MLAPPLVITVIEATQNRIAAAFTEWERRYREEPERFMSEAEKLLKETPQSYGDACAPYFLAILQEQAGVTPARTVHTSAPATRPAIGEPYEGGIYAGHTLENEQPMALVLLPGDEELNWKDAHAWAQQRRGVLPSRIDQLVLWQNVKSEFKQAAYWSAEPFAGSESCAWYQSFPDGFQFSHLMDYKLRARAVRRVAISQQKEPRHE